MVVIVVRIFFYIKIKFRGMNKDWVSGKLYKFEEKFIPFPWTYVRLKRESKGREFYLNS